MSEGEISVYSAILNLGIAPVNSIHEKTGIERRNIYDILNKLIDRGLITYYRENKRRIFRVSHPNKILSYVEEKKDELERTKGSISQQIPELIKKYKLIKPDIDAEIFRGKEGVKTVWEDMLNYKDTYWIGSGRYVPLKLPIWFANWNNRRVKKKVKWHNILRYEAKEGFKKFKFEYTKLLPRDFSGNPTVICTYGDKTINFLFGEDYFAFVIESKRLAENYRRYHKYLWDNLCT